MVAGQNLPIAKPMWKTGLESMGVTQPQFCGHRPRAGLRRRTAGGSSYNLIAFSRYG
jgi:hypothetical protein